jgi:DNA mismatch repair protein MutL
MADKIAAGEVVERPASVVKELTENSLDAGARNINVEVTGSGRQLIRIEDDGSGMSSDDLLLSLERHATSKIKKVEDIYSVRTLGFRGEALPSIASVSKMRIASSQDSADLGKMVIIEGGILKKVEEMARPRGTAVEVRSLFYNTPARLKFLKSQATEQGWITTFFQQQALARLDVSFRLKVGGKEMVNAPAADSLRDRIASLLGIRLGQSLLEVEYSRGPLKLTGFVSDPSVSRSGRDLQFMYVNNRWVRERVAQSAVTKGYRTILPRGRFPVVLLYLEMDPALVDVNVHPAKLEVKFQDSGAVHDAIVEAITSGLGRRRTSHAPERKAETEEILGDRSETPGKSPPVEVNGRTAPSPGAPVLRGQSQTFNTYAGSRPFERVPGAGAPQPSPPNGSQRDRQAGQTPRLERQLSLSSVSALIPLGQLDKTFIIARNGEGIVIIDQHTAHERVLFNKILDQFRRSRVLGQQLLIPQTVSLSSLEVNLIQEKKDELEKLGFLVEAFGKNTVILRSIPALLSDSDCTQLFQEIAAHLSELGRVKPFHEIAEDLAVLMACKGAVKAGESLSEVQMTALIRGVESLEQPATCPHGRPIHLLLGTEEIRKKFLRT